MDTVAQIMTTNVRSAKVNDVIGSLRDLMIDNHIGCVPVLDESGDLKGIVTSSDLVEEWSPQMGVATVMTSDVLTSPPHRSVVEAARLMVDKHVHHLVVTERNVVLGVVSSFDVMTLLAGRIAQTQAEANNTPLGFHAKVGDHIVVRGAHIGERDRKALIEEVRGDSGGPPYMVRWLTGATDERKHLYFPGTDAVIEPA